MIKVQKLNKIYKTGAFAFHALKDVSLEIKEGEFVAIMGASGSGKSTLLHLLGFLDRPDSGSYTILGKEVTHLSDDELALMRNHLAGFVFQQFHLLPRMTALQNAQLPLIYAGKRSLSGRAAEKIAAVGLQPRQDHRPNEMSGGEQQRVAIARSLVNEPAVIFADEPTGNLDTKSEAEIMSILEDLNKQGKTIIMVTHEREIAERARRIITMRDGVILSDVRNKPEPALKNQPCQTAACDAILNQKHSVLKTIEFADHLRQAFQAIYTHKMRSLLSMLGILIGVAAVIAMLALGQGAKEAIQKSLSSLGSNLLVVRPGSRNVRGIAMQAGEITRFTMADSQDMQKVESVSGVSAWVRGRARVAYGNKNWDTQLEGQGISYASMRAAMPVAGRFFTEDEVRMRQRVAVIGATLVRELFDNQNPVGATIKLNRLSFQVIGILPVKGADAFHDRDDVVVIPVTTAMFRVLGKEYVDGIDVQVKDASLMKDAQDELKGLIIKRQRLTTKEKQNSFEIRDMTEIQETLQQTTKTMAMLLGAIAAISLLVGGIGIMNIMLVSVTERTREIGLRKAIGARAKDIMFQFLVEAVVMTFTGGILGIALGVGIAFLLSAFAGWATTVSISSIILATVFSVGVGIGFGLWPARQASRLNPIEALRYE
jgi:macrolide transport system ATP-binding/permease protein